MAAARCSTLGCTCACHRPRQEPRLWTPDMDRQLSRAIDRGDTIRTIATAMRLTEESIRWRVKKLGRSLREGWRSRAEIARCLGVPRRSVDRWARDGHLVVTRHGTRWTRVRDVDLWTFVGQHAGALFDPLGVSDPTFRRLAETAAMANRRRAG